MWAVGPYEIDPVSFELQREGVSIALQKRPLDLLLYLIARPNQIVSREELEARVWGGVAVSSGALSTALYEARAALGDLDRSPQDRWLETVRGRGFRFSGPVERLGNASAANSLPLMVGRADLVADLARDLEDLEEGVGGVRVIEGVAGMGKTRLLQEVTSDPGAATAYTVYCERGGPPYWPWMQVARALDPTAESPGVGKIGRLDGTASTGGAARSNFEFLEGMLQAFSAAAVAKPLVLAIEDIHWADVQSLELLASLAPRVASLPVLILVTHRVGEQGDAARAWIRSPHIRRIRLAPLHAGEIYQLTSSIIGKVPLPEFVGWIKRHSDGVPLLVQELAEQLQGDSVLPDVPEIAQAMFARRFDGLTSEGRGALAIAALCGERFDVPLVEAAAGDLLQAGRSWIREGLASGIVVADTSQPLNFSFRHSLFREAARGGLDKQQAAHWHGRLLRVLEKLHPDPDSEAVSQLAHHSSESALIESDLDRPLRYALLAARNAGEVFAWEEVRIHSEHALGWVRFMQPGPKRDRQELDAALLRCAGITPYSGHVEETGKLLERIEPVLARTQNAADRALALAFRFANARTVGDFELALAQADAVAEIDGMQAVATCWRLGVASLAGEFAAATAVPECEDDLGDDSRFIAYARLCGRDPEVDRLGLTAFASFYLGHDADALERAERAVLWAEHRGDARSKIWALFMLCMLHDQRRDWPALRATAREVDELAERHRITPWVGAGILLGSWAKSHAEEDSVFPAEAFAAIARDRGNSSNVSLRSLMLLLSSRISLRSKDLAGAEIAAREGLAFCERTHDRHARAELERQFARVLQATGEGQAAQEARFRALEIARLQGNVVAEVRTLVDCIDAGHGDAAIGKRLHALRKRLGPRFGPHERELLER